MRLAQATSIASTILALALCKPAQGQTSPPAPSSLEDITGCSLDGDSVFIAIGRDATARRYRYPWDPSIDALCNAKGFAIGAPKGAAAATRTPAPSQAPAAVQAPALATAPPRVSASGEATEFPADALPLTAEAVNRKVSGKLFDVQFRNGSRWRLNYRSSGYLFVETGEGNGSGPWRAQENRLCSRVRTPEESCNEVRELGPLLYLKRDNGDVIALTPR